ncbi:T9SS type A sorting domain-containing protein [Flavobacterium solisilvae]|uniref:T9SS type A sorting domain-containing protein n=1 Tax=Flavobacterium solisilvae TaxID=1852019 RepID=A0ABX1QXY5_9FLAO|nr:T9SS type A sorting domain-containing protein [Flavobacterium solisilvae]NMH26003.1 T9SS type A sorting domain-containing protein [Flavobacterium solisilvae]
MKNIFFLLFASSCFPQAGSYDTTFGSNGKSTHCLEEWQTYNNMDADFQSTGKIISYSTNYSAVGASLVRWNTNGSLDTTFGVNGFINFMQSGVFINGGHLPFDMVIQPDDKIIIMGTQQNDVYYNSFWVARLLPNGELDTSFNGTGYKDVLFGTTQGGGTCVALQPDGKILLGGSSGNTADLFAVARLNSDGSFDTDFGINGKTQIAFNGTESFIQSMALQADGKIVLGGYTVAPTKDFALARINSNGTLDTTFGTNGKMITTLSTTHGDVITDLIIEPDGKIVAGGIYSYEFNSRVCLVRYTSSGSIDNSFGTNGIFINANYYSRNCSLARQLDGKFVSASGWDGTYFIVARYNNNGTLDTAFGDTGYVNAFYGYAAKILLQSDDKIVVTGTIFNSDDQVCTAIIRLNPGTLSVEEFEDEEVVVYPNPSNGIFQLTFNEAFSEKIEYSVYDVLGKIIVEKENSNDLDATEVNLENYPAGIYLLRMKIGEVVVNKKLLKN